MSKRPVLIHVKDKPSSFYSFALLTYRIFFILVQEAGVTLADHHSTSESFIKHMEKEVCVFFTFLAYLK